ncbi:MAG: DUF2786 domain-containing protein [Rhodospirillaceae bacterium]
MTATVDFEKLGKILALAGSNHDGEALAALKKAGAMLKAGGMSFTDIAQKLKAPASVQFKQFGWPPPQQPKPKPKPKGYTVGGVTWESREVYEAHCDRQAAQREAERARYAPQRAAVLEKYGSELAAIARDPREQALHDAAAPWLEGPNSLEPGYEHLAGRWHDSVGGWKRYDFGRHPVAECRAAIEAALPLPRTIREARDEVRYWDERNDELCHALESWGEEQLDLPAAYRREMVRRLYEIELPIRTLDDLHIRLLYAVEADTKDDVCRAAPSNLDAFERLVVNGASVPPCHVESVQSGHPHTASARRCAVLDMLSNPNTANLPDREIARRAGVSPSTVGALRRKGVRND